jgi:UPF0271 protein
MLRGGSTMKEYTVDVNADMGESFGRYRLGNDEEVMKYVTSANLACGFHAGDPTVMRRTVRLAKKYNVAIGAHPGFQDLRGFGRRSMSVTPEEVYEDVLYQIGALDAFVKVEKVEMHHISPHGALDPLVSNAEEYAEAFLSAVQDYNAELIVVAESKSILYDKCKLAGVRVASVALPDLKYDSKGNWIMPGKAKEPANPIEVAEQAVSIVKNHRIKTVDGEYIETDEAAILCFHADSPNAVEVLRKVREEFDKQGINVRAI